MNLERLIGVYEFAKEAHKGQKRKSGGDYIMHPIAVANMAKEKYMDDETIYACLLHDVVEDTDYTLRDIKREFGKNVAYLVDGVTEEDTLDKTMDKIEKYTEKDDRVIVIKMLDRIHNLRTAIDPREKNKILISLKKYNVSTRRYIEIGKRKGYDIIARELQDELDNLIRRLGPNALD